MWHIQKIIEHNNKKKDENIEYCESSTRLKIKKSQCVASSKKLLLMQLKGQDFVSLEIGQFQSKNAKIKIGLIS